MGEPLESFCGSQLWNNNKTWLTDSPELTECFEQTALVWIPSLLLLVFLPLDLHYSLNSQHRNIPWNCRFISKLILNTCLLFVCIVEFVYAFIHLTEGATVYYVHLYTPVIKFISSIICVGLLLLHRKYGKMSSGLLFFYWLMISILGIPQFRTDIIAYQKGSELPLLRISYLIYYIFCVSIFILNFFADAQPLQCSYRVPQYPCPENYSSFPSRITYFWFKDLVQLGYKRPLVMEDLWNVNFTELADTVSLKFHHYWFKSVNNYFRELQTKLTRTKSGSIRFIKDGDLGSNDGPSVLIVLIKSFGVTALSGGLFKLAVDMLGFINPLMVKLIIMFIEGNEPMWRGYAYVMCLFSYSVVSSLLNAQYCQKMFLVGLRARTSLMSAVYRKALRISCVSKRESTLGETVNLMAIDAQRVMDALTDIHVIWTGCLQIIVGLYFLWTILGLSAFAGLAVIFLMIPYNVLITDQLKKHQVFQMTNKDERVKFMNEILSGIKVLKLYAWEQCFQQNILKIRKEEVKHLKYTMLWTTVISFNFSMTPFLVSLASFCTFTLSDDNNILNAETIFVSLSILALLRVPFSMLPLAVIHAIQGSTSIKRINKFMNLPEIDFNCVSHNYKDDPLVMNKCTLSWEEEGGEILKDISLRVKEGSLVAVVGAVGSGKSSLLSALLGEMHKISGNINTKGSVAYVPQIPWIQNDTVKNNIVFSKPYNKFFYEQVVRSCSLQPDFELFPAEDETEIGERGLNVSGGQKQRISIARAVYFDADVYLLDDPLSAVDSHVGKHIFRHIIGPKGLLSRKTRLIVTHSIRYLQQCDYIIVMKEGKISESGSYQKLLNRAGDFSDFLLSHSQDVDPTLNPKDSVGAQTTDQHLDPLSRKASANSGQDSISTNRCLSASNSKSSDLHLNEMNNDITNGKLVDEERAFVGQIKWSVLKHYLSSIGLPYISLVIFAFVVSEGFYLGCSIWLSIWSNDEEMYVNGVLDTAKRDTYLGIYGLLGFCSGVAVLLADILPNLGCWWAGIISHNDLLNNVVRLPLSFFEINPTGRLLARFSKDVDIMEDAIPRNICDTVFCLFDFFGILLIICYSCPYFIIAVIPIMLVFHFIQRLYLSTVRQLNRLISISRSPIYSHFSETIEGCASIRAFKAEGRFIRESGEKIDTYQMCSFPVLIAERWMCVLLEFVCSVIVTLSALIAVVGRDSISPGLAGLILLHTIQVTDMTNYLLKSYSRFVVNLVSIERIKEYTDLNQEAAWEVEGTEVSQRWPEKGEVVFKDFSVRYREGLDCVLNGITFSIRGGEKVGVVGRTGAGKSSLTVSLFRIIEPAGGSIYIDNLDISKLGLHTLRSRLTIIPQDPILFSGTLRLNLDPFEKHSDAEIWSAIKSAHLEDFIKSQPNGLQYSVSGGGENLSVGQRQLLCLARALLRKTKVLILDEATAAVDLDTDDLIQKTIRSEFADCTVLTIAHRINTIMDSDLVMVLENGFLVEFDNPDHLLRNRESKFFLMCRAAGLI